MGNNFNQNSFRNRNRGDKKPKISPNEFKLPLELPENLSTDVHAEILEVLENNRFDKISIPLNTYKGLIESTDVIDNRVSTVGYIRNYDKESKTFTVIIFNRFVELVKSWGENAIINLTCVDDRNGHLKTITKFNVLPGMIVTEEDEE